MKRATITIHQLLEEGKYYKQIPCYIIFALAGILAFAICVMGVESTKELLMVIVFVGIPFLIPFGYFLGIKKLRETLIDVCKIKKGLFYIIERECIDKQVVSNKDSSNDTQIILGETSGVWVSRKKSKEIKVGDICYVIYLEGDKKPSAIFSKKKYELEDSLKLKIRNGSSS